jgi:hypothetical protein
MSNDDYYSQSAGSPPPSGNPLPSGNQPPAADPTAPVPPGGPYYQYPDPGQQYAAPGQPYPDPGQQYAAPGQPYPDPGQQYAAPGQPYPDPNAGQAGYWDPNPQMQAYQPAYGYATAKKTNGLAIASMVLSIISILSCGFIGIAGAIMGHVARKQIRANGEDGDGMALAGVIVGWISTAIWTALVAIWVVALIVAASNSTY